MSVDQPGTIQAPTSPPPDSPADSPRRIVVLLFILATAVIFVSLFAILYFRWAGAREPSSMLVVTASPAFEGVQITVDGIQLPKPHAAVVDGRRGHTVPFYLDRGAYTLQLSRDAERIYSTDFTVSDNSMLRLDLTKLEHLLPPPTTAANAKANADIGTTDADAAGPQLD